MWSGAKQMGKYIAHCKYPRCKLQPETDYEDTEEEVERDWNMIKDSLRGADKGPRIPTASIL